MAKDVGAEIPAGLRRVHRQLEHWRSTRRGRSPLPEALWRAAADAAREHEVFRTGRVLHLEYGKLKRVMNAKMGKTPARTAFVELAAMDGENCVLAAGQDRGGSCGPSSFLSRD